jgi:tRNA (cytidine/uridine-2'-O-)-methyltransferase
MNTNSVQFFKQHPVEGPVDGSELIVAAWKLSNPENIGKIIRMAHNVSASQVLFVQGHAVHRPSKIKNTAGFSYEQMPWRSLSEEEFLNEILSRFQLTVLETCEGATNIFTTKLPRQTLLLAGSESAGLPAQIIERSRCRVYIPMPGGCKSMNISNALSVAAFEWLRQHIC